MSSLDAHNIHIVIEKCRGFLREDYIQAMESAADEITRLQEVVKRLHAERRNRKENAPMSDLPRLALSVRQPWAWAIIHGGKDIENRTWQAVNHGLRQRGRIAIHASKGMARDEYEEAAEFINDLLSYWQGSAVRCPAPADLLRGGIIGSVEVIDVVSESKSPWFFGPRGLVLANPQPCDFIPSVGALGYFEWRQADPSIVPAPARWMLPKAESRDTRHEAQVLASEPDLFL